MSKQERDTSSKRQSAEDAGYNPKPWDGLHIHAGNTPKHEFVKFCICFILEDIGHEWDSETTCETGRVDVFDFGPTDGRALVYEVETDVTPAQAQSKVNQYRRGPVRDVIVIDPDDVPDRFDEAIEYLQTHEIIG